MYRLQVWCGYWRWGVQVYTTKKEARKRVLHLLKMGIRSRIKPENELFE